MHPVPLFNYLLLSSSNHITVIALICAGWARDDRVCHAAGAGAP